MRIKTIIPILLTGAIAFLLSCNKSSSVHISETASARVPVAVIVERELSGTILGTTLRSPFGVAVDQRGRLYCVDAGNNRVLLFRQDLSPVSEIGGTGSTSRLLGKLTFITVDNDLNILVTDESNQRIVRFDSRLNLVDEIPFYDTDNPLKFGYPSGVGLTGYGEMWVADREFNRIAVFNNIGQFDTFIGDFGYSGGQLLVPMKIILDDGGQFIVCDAGNSRLVLYDVYGNYIRDIRDDRFDFPGSVVADKEGIWVLDSNSKQLLYLNKKGKLLFQAGPQLPGTSLSLQAPSDIVILPDHRLIIADSGNNRLVVCRIVYSE